MSCSDDIFMKEAYSENASLTVFLDSLSYHKVGAAFFATQIVRLNPRTVWNMIDIGCGNGQFTSELLGRLKQSRVAPTSITAIDPDGDNLVTYAQRVREQVDVRIRSYRSGVEALPVGQWFIVLLSHSLYQFMENPHIADVTKNRVLGGLSRMVAKNGGLLISMASRTSPAYEYKRRVLEYAALTDRSVFGEEIAKRFQGPNRCVSETVCDSYMDVTRLLAPGKKALLDWTRYFCRLSIEQVERIGVDRLRAVLCSLSKRFTEVPVSLAKTLTSAPASCGALGEDSIVLLHKECFIVVKRHMPIEK